MNKIKLKPCPICGSDKISLSDGYVRCTIFSCKGYYTSLPKRSWQNDKKRAKYKYDVENPKTIWVHPDGRASISKSVYLDGIEFGNKAVKYTRLEKFNVIS